MTALNPAVFKAAQAYCLTLGDGRKVYAVYKGPAKTRGQIAFDHDGADATFRLDRIESAVETTLDEAGCNACGGATTKPKE